MEFININRVNSSLRKSIHLDEELCASMSYNFALNLPYSMDYCDEDFVIGDFINVIPINRESHLLKDYGTIYKGLLNFDNMRMNSIIIRICNIFQNMLVYGTDINEFDDVDYARYEFDKLTKDKEENLRIFLMLKELPRYCNMINSVLDTDERRKLLDEVYKYIYFSVNNKVIKDDYIGMNISCFCIDMENLFYYNGINFDKDITSVNEAFKEYITRGLESKKRVRN